MLKNMGSFDRILRVVLAAVVGLLLITGSIGGTTAIVLGIISVVFLATSFAGFCPLYAPCKISTRKAEGAGK